jgi:two-component system response regulator RegA
MNRPLLLIDDDKVFLETLARSLQRRGETVLIASNSEEALQAIREFNPDRAVLDLNLAGESGLQLLTQMLEQSPQLRIIMLTGYASIVTAVDAMKRGALNYLCKPVNATQVLQAFGEATEPEEQEKEIEDTTPLSVDRLEWEHIQRVLHEHDGNISATARALNMHRRTLQRKLQKKPASR